MKCKAFKFARLTSSQFGKCVDQLNEFLAEVEPLGLPQVAASDEDGTVMFVFYKEKSLNLEPPAPQSKSKKE